MSNFNLVFASQNMPRLQKPYIVINVMNIELPDHVIYGKDINANGFRNIYAWRSATIELQIYNGIESLTSASILALAIQSEQSLQQQGKLNCAIGPRLFFAYVPEMLNTSQWEGRAVYHFIFFYTETFAEDVGLIETVIIDGTYTGGGTEDITCHEEITYQIPYTETMWDGPTVTPFTDESYTDWDGANTSWDEELT
jgi:hypothetical protein